MAENQYTVEAEYNGLRIDKYLSVVIEGLSRAKLKNVFDENNVKLNSIAVKPSQRVSPGDIIDIVLPEISEADIEAQNIPIDIIYEDDDLLIVNKAQGMTVHPAPGNCTNTLVNALMYHVKDLSSINGVIRPGIVHRIDKDTSGLLVVAKNNEAHIRLSEQFSTHSITREYTAIVHGQLKTPCGKIELPIGRDRYNRLKMAVTYTNCKNAVTNFKQVKAYTDFTHVNLKLETGRTHQIRVHMKYIGNPVVGDKLYGRNTALDRQFEGQLLHAFKLGFIHPSSGKYIEFNSELPQYFSKMLEIEP